MATRGAAPLIVPSFKLPQVLYDELCSAVRGPVCRPSDAEFAERARTFNGKLKSLSRVLVSPLDAHDVSTVVRFCTKHKLSPSIRAGGYGIAGWSVAGDVIIDLSMLKEVDIEPPLEARDGEKDWTRLRDMPPPGSKGKGRAETAASKRADNVGSTVVNAGATTASQIPSSQLDRSQLTAGVKRRREESEGTPDRDPGVLSADQAKRNHLHSYDAASYTVASFLRGPPLPPEAGETPRGPPVHRPRLHSPEPLASQDEATFLPEEVREAHAQKEPRVPEIGNTSYETWSNSASSMAASSSPSSELLSASGSGSSLATHGTSVTTPLTASPEIDSNKDAAESTEQKPFGYMTSNGPPEPHAPMYSGGNPFQSASISAAGSSSWTAPTTTAQPTGHSPRTTMLGMNMSMSFPSGSSFSSLNPSSSMPLDSIFGQGNLGMAPAKPIHGHAYVTFGAGMRQKEIDMYTAEHPLEGISGVTGLREDGMVPYHMPSSAHPVGSSIMLLGGFGFLSRMYGLSIDNLVEVEMVLADGRIVIVSEEDDPDLWWAMRGAGPAFGIVTRYKARAFPVPVVFAGNLIYRFHRATAPSLIKHFRDCIKGAPRELYANVLLTAGPADKDSLVVIQMCYVGPKEEGMVYLQAISSWDGERCLLNEVNEKSFLNQQDSVAQVLRGKAGRQWFIRSSLIHSLPDEVINKTVIQFANTPIGCTWLFELAGGAILDFEGTCLPKQQREATWTVAALHQWEMGIDDPRCITSAEEWMNGTIGTVALGGPYPTVSANTCILCETKPRQLLVPGST
ncbi:hypothetical protein AcW1_003384 [Taiwanofungus camphoratus]|nr:hypothetical protein AcW1_003384 [Antrodia cinnamomea]